MKNIMLTLWFFAIILPVVGQETDSVKTTKDQISLDVNLLGLGFTIHKPINDKYALTYGVQGGIIVSYVPIYYDGTFRRLKYNTSYAKQLGIYLGVTSFYNKNWTNSVLLNLGKPFDGIDDHRDYGSPYGGISLQTFYKISSSLSLGTNISIDLIVFDNSHVLYLSNSFVTCRMKIGK